MSITFTWNNPNTNEYTPELTVIYRSESQFEADALPEPFEELPGAVTSYTDNLAVDGTTYFYRVSFKLGIRENVSRLIEIKAPTSPDFFETVKLASVFTVSRNYGSGIGDMCVVVDDFNNFKWATAQGANGGFGSWVEKPWKSMDSMLVRITAMVAIQRYRRSVWITERFTMIAANSITSFGTTANGEFGFTAGQQSGIAAGSTLSWKQAFDIIGKSHASMDICLNVFNELRADIFNSLTYSRGRPPAEYHPAIAISLLYRFVCQLGGYNARNNPFRGNGRFVNQSGAIVYYAWDSDSQSCGSDDDALAFFRVLRAVFSEYPEIKSAIAVWDMSYSLPYQDASANVIDWLTQGTNDRDKADPIIGMSVPNGTGTDTNIVSQRGRNLNGNVQMPPDSFGMCGLGHANATTSNGICSTGFFLTSTPNGKDFATLFTDGYANSHASYDIGRIWNKASAFCESYTEGLSEVDPLESQVVLRYIPHLGLVDQSSAGTSLQFPSGSTANPANHFSGANASPGFPDLALAFRGSDTTGLGTILTNLNMLEYIIGGTSFTIEMFTSNLWTPGQVVDNAAISIIELGTTSTARYDGIIMYPYDCAFARAQHASHTSSRSIVMNQGYFMKAFTDSTEANFNQRNGSRFFNHIVLQYDAIANVFEFFGNGVMINRWTPNFLPTSGLGATLSLFGQKDNPTNTTTQRHYAYAGQANMEHLIHEVVVTLTKRYNYANFIGKVPFARKRFTS